MVWMLGLVACVSGSAPIGSTYTSETPVSELSDEQKEDVCETQLERAADLEPVVCNGNEVDPTASLSECTTIVLGLLEGCGLAVGDFEACISEMLDDPCALFQEPPPPGCAPLVECLYVPE
ncbi:MAG: hypothetical protein KC656_06870 [Myxococcales bacterium]|nr:hypothetical protein [Myxococcales bacterium]MCB9671315.1 hypothetical protein [Alphaproteobacteria bacterium]MCB9694825.1 hypothetical protein [Alphaproteobacteria bacterium]